MVNTRKRLRNRPKMVAGKVLENEKGLRFIETVDARIHRHRIDTNQIIGDRLSVLTKDTLRNSTIYK